MKLKIFFQNSLLFDLEFEFRDLILMGKIPHTPYVSVLLHLKFGGFGIGYGIGRKYLPNSALVSVSDLHQNSDFGRSQLQSHAIVQRRSIRSCKDKIYWTH